MILQTPTVTSVSEFPATVQTDGVFELNDAARPDVAVAFKAIGVALNGREAGPVNKII